MLCVEGIISGGFGVEELNCWGTCNMYQCFLSILIIQRLCTPLEAQGTTKRCGYAAMLAAQDMHHGPLIRQSQNQDSNY